ncbi:entry exclusion protein TrbK [Rhizobium sp. LjRoot258]|uniref:entry exclusion protein TrbK n=1 Tax=Rhizobium sp. LjRoot258 TaxID=3342299 RepID=UPI003ECD26EB
MSRVRFVMLAIAVAATTSAAFFWPITYSTGIAPWTFTEEQRAYRDRFFGSHVERPLNEGQEMRPRW